MTRDEMRQLVVEKLLQVAPDIDPQDLDPSVPIRDQYDFDSMDFMNFAIAVGREFQMDIPEKDYGRLLSLNDAVLYVQENIASNATGE